MEGLNLDCMKEIQELKEEIITQKEEISSFKQVLKKNRSLAEIYIPIFALIIALTTSIIGGALSWKTIEQSEINTKYQMTYAYKQAAYQEIIKLLVDSHVATFESNSNDFLQWTDAMETAVYKAIALLDVEKENVLQEMLSDYTSLCSDYNNKFFSKNGEVEHTGLGSYINKKTNLEIGMREYVKKELFK